MKYFFLLALVASTIHAQWIHNGTPICTAQNGQTSPVAVSDSTGGAIIAWIDLRNAHPEIYAQHITATGVVMWPENGVALASSTTITGLVGTSDNAGGAIFAWQDVRSGSNADDIYAQRVDACGRVLWTTNGIKVCGATLQQREPQIVSDGAGGAFITWIDERSPAMVFDVFVQHLDKTGAALLAADGVNISNDVNNITYHPLIDMRAGDDGRGGIVVGWSHPFPGDAVMQRVKPDGSLAYTNVGTRVCQSEAISNTRVGAGPSGGGVIAWIDNRNFIDTALSIYTQMTDSTGLPLWMADGVDVFDKMNFIGDIGLSVVTDGRGGAFIAAIGSTILNESAISVRRVSSNGTAQGTGGNKLASLSTASQFQELVATSDNAKGIYTAWSDRHDTTTTRTNIVAMRGDSVPNPRWISGGVAICDTTGDQTAPSIVASGIAGAIIVWEDKRNNSGSDIYAYGINYAGTAPLTGSPATTVQSFHPATGANTQATSITILGQHFLCVTGAHIDDSALTKLTGTFIVNPSGTIITGPSVPAGIVPGSYHIVLETEYGMFTSDSLFVVTGIVGVNNEINKRSVFLEQNHPNPAGSFTFIPYETGNEHNAHLAITNMLGQVLLNVPLDGNHLYELSTTALPTGMYRYELVTGSSRRLNKMMSVIH